MKKTVAACEVAFIVAVSPSCFSDSPVVSRGTICRKSAPRGGNACVPHSNVFRYCTPKGVYVPQCRAHSFCAHVPSPMRRNLNVAFPFYFCQHRREFLGRTFGLPFHVLTEARCEGEDQQGWIKNECGSQREPSSPPPHPPRILAR